METLSHSEEQVMTALWDCGKPAARREIAARLPAGCNWADSTLLNFLLRLENKRFVRSEKQGNKNLYTPLVRRLTYCGAVSAGCGAGAGQTSGGQGARRMRSGGIPA